MMWESGIDAALRSALPPGAAEVYLKAKADVASWEPRPMPAGLIPARPEWTPCPRLRVSPPIDPIIGASRDVRATPRPHLRRGGSL